MEPIGAPVALFLGYLAQKALVPPVKEAVTQFVHSSGMSMKKEKESDTNALLSRCIEWVEDTLPAVVLGCAGLVANNQVPITILILTSVWILGCRAYRWWLLPTDSNNTSAPQKPAKRPWLSRLRDSVFPSRQLSISYANSTVKVKTILEISAHRIQQASGTGIEEELARHQLPEKMQQKVDGGVKILAPFLNSFLSKRVGENAGGELLHSTTFTDRRSSVVNPDATKGLSRKTAKTIANIQTEMWNGPALTLEEQKQGFSYVAWMVVPLEDRNEGRLVVLWHKIEDNDRHSGEVATFRLSAPFMARFVEPSRWQQYTLWYWFLVIAAAVALFGVLAYHYTALPLTPEPIFEGNVGVDVCYRPLGEEESAVFSDVGPD